MTTPARIPADVDREDRLIGDLTARQLAILATTTAAVYALWLLCFRGLPTWSPAWAHIDPLLRGLVFAAAAAPVALAGLALTLGRRDGMPLDRLLIAAARQRLATPTLNTNRTADTNQALNASRAAAAALGSRSGRRRGGAGRVVVPWVPARAIREARVSREIGVVELGRAGLALICAVTPISLTLRSPAEQDQLVAGMARWLHSLTASVQILVRTTPLDLTGHLHRVRAAADQLPHPALGAAAHAHADHLTDLARHTDLLRRRIYLVFHEPSPPATPHTADPHDDTTPGNQTTSDTTRSDTARGASPARLNRAVRAAEEQLLRRAEEADQLLGAIGLRITPLDPRNTAHILHAATHPDQHLTPPLPSAPRRPAAAPRRPRPQRLLASELPSQSRPAISSAVNHRPSDSRLINPAVPSHPVLPGAGGPAMRTPASPIAPISDPGHRSSAWWDTGHVDPDEITADLYELSDLAAYTDVTDHTGFVDLDGYERDDEQLEQQNLHTTDPTYKPGQRAGEGDGNAPPWSREPGTNGHYR